MRIALPLCCAVVVAALAACGDDFTLPPANASNRVDTVAVYALTGTAVGAPSGYQLEFRRVVRTDQTSLFDFAFDITTAGDPVFLPTGALGLGEGSGLQVSPEPFDSITLAPTSGYVYDTTAAAGAGAELLVQSRVTTCSYGGSASYYAKLRVLTVDMVARRADFEILVNINCGYRGLEPGLPTQ
ncbi:MAG TPA: hypothetical protein VD707_04240 [Gemmatimonadales bacterium]|jgi:hypothetical protein|nr:hypothetical protein [Gemmatimonadales bacterium]